MTGAQPCSHLRASAARAPATPTTAGCSECLQRGGVWVHLRLCLTCGHVGCCDDSPSRHATKHFHHTGHPVIRSYEPGEDWGYCYPDEIFVEEIPALPGEAATRHIDPPGG